MINFFPEMVRHKLLTTATFALFFFLSLSAFGQTRWVASWGTALQIPEPHNALAPEDLRDATLRQIVHLSVGGSELRVTISNRFGTAPLHFAAVHIARPVSPASAKIVEGSDTALRFSGQSEVMVPAGAEYHSDPIKFSVAPLSDLVITLYLDSPPDQQTGHPGSRATSYYVHGNQVGAGDLPSAKTVEHWYFISEVDVAAPPQANALVILGDSITDGHGATTNGNDRWPDTLAKRLQENVSTRSVAVVNKGIGGNRLLLDGLGPNALARFTRDVIAPAGSKWAIVLEGVNDLGMFWRAGAHSQAEHEELVHGIISTYEQMILRAHSHGIQMIGGTIMPFGGGKFYNPGPEVEADRQAINQWIRTPGHFDAVIDFDRITRDPEHPNQLLSAYDSGDHLHPSHAGYEAMANAVPLSLFSSAPGNPKIAFTFDDLPEHGPLPPGETRLAVIQKILGALHEAHLPPIYGFVNGAPVEQHPDEIAALEAWRRAGNPLGNHTWSHMNLNQHTLAEFETEVTRNEPLLKKLMDGQDWHWLRYPYLAEGDTPEKRAGVRAFLLQHGYKVADVTMSFGDYEWNDPYARCVAKGDTKSIELLESSYLSAADDSIFYYRELSQRLFNRDIPYVLLMHVGAFDARMLPRLLDLYRSRGFDFVTLDEAERDPFYRVDTDLSQPPAPDMLEGVAGMQHVTAPPRPPRLQLDTLCR